MVWRYELNGCRFDFILFANALTLHGTGREAGACTTWLLALRFGAGPAFVLRFKSEWVPYANLRT
jgi:hypothetical protein